MPGTVIAVYFLVTGITGLQMLGAANYVQSLFYGGALVVAVLLSKVTRNLRLTRQAAAARAELAAANLQNRPSELKAAES